MNIVDRLKRWRRRRQLRAYLSSARKLLGQRYGKLENYSANHVSQCVLDSAAERNNAASFLSAPNEDSDLPFALAIFCTREEYSAYAKQKGLVVDYWESRRTIADLFFGGNLSFTRQDVKNLLMPEKAEPYDTGIPNIPSE